MSGANAYLIQSFNHQGTKAQRVLQVTPVLPYFKNVFVFIFVPWCLDGHFDVTLAVHVQSGGKMLYLSITARLFVTTGVGISFMMMFVTVLSKRTTARVAVSATTW